MAVVYRHLKPCGEVFYIGIGNESKRAYDFLKRSMFWKSVVSRHPNYEVQILKSDMTLEDAKELEIILIEYYGRRDLGTGTLCNMNDGGQGSKGRINKPYTEERLKSMKESKLKSLEKTPKYICTKTLKTFGSIGLCAKHARVNRQTLLSYLNPNNPAKNTTHIMKIEDYEKYGAIKPHIAEKKEIACIHTLTGRIYLSVSQAAKEQGMNVSKLASILFDKRMLNRTFIIPISEYNGDIHYPEVPCINEKYGTHIKNKTTGEVFVSKASLGRHLGVSTNAITKWIEKGKIDYEYI